MAHVIRPLEIAKILREKGYDVVFAGEGRHMQVPAQAGFETRHLPDFDGRKLLSMLGKDPSRIHSVETAEEWVEAEIELMVELNPWAVLDDFRVTCGISTTVLDLPRFTVLNGHTTPYGLSTLLDPDLPGPRSAFSFGTEAIYNQVRQKYGLPPVDHPLALMTGDQVLVCDIPEICPMREDTPDNYHYIGPITWDVQLPPPSWVEDLDWEKPLVYLSMGSTGSKESYQLAIEAFTGTEYQVMMTLGNVVDVEDLGDLPENIHAVKIASGDLLAYLADVVVCHAGNGTVYQALAHGTPLVTLPLGREQYWNARRHTELGTNLTVENADADKLRAAVTEVLRDPSYKANACRIQSLLSDYHGPRQAAGLIHEYIEELVYA
jgi:UDP:flavonoid glycosyltransferase YjiC (YdhE family)